MNKISWLCLIFLVLIVSCGPQNDSYKIGVSQCSQGRWREKVNNEMFAAQHLYEHDIEVSVAISADDTELQIRQIDSLLSTGIDLLVVAPNEAAPLSEVLGRALKKNIPVILFDRKSTTGEYTAFIGGNNYEAGEMMGRYAENIAKQTTPHGDKPFIMEITGSMSTTPAVERHEGFCNAIKKIDSIEYVCRQGDWTSDEACRLITEQINTGHLPDIVFCHNDGMATGVYKAVVENNIEGKIKILGIDGLPGEGLEYVQFGHQIGTYVYPTHGEKIVRLAIDILSGRHYEKENTMHGILVTPDNVDLVAASSTELMNQNANLVTVQNKLEDYTGLYRFQNKIIAIAAATIIILLTSIVLIWKSVLKTQAANQKIKALSDEQTAFYTNARHQLRTPLTLVAGPIKKLLESTSIKDSDRELLEIVNRNIKQLENVAAEVLNFKTDISKSDLVDDGSARDIIAETISENNLQESRLEQMKHDDSDDLATVLIVDDNADLRRYLRTLLCDKFCVLEASDGENGMQLSRECVPDIIVSDVMMPVMDGLEFCKKIKGDNITSHIPVILLTARSTSEQRTEGYEHGADAYLTKPFSPQMLVVRIYNLLKNRQRLRNISSEYQETPSTVVNTQDKIFADALKKAFKKHISNSDLTMDDLGAELGMSRIQLYRKVKALTGISPVELMREMRLQHAYTLLVSTTKTIAEVSYESGFNTPSYFSKCFKKQFGKYPTDIRE